MFRKLSLFILLSLILVGCSDIEHSFMPSTEVVHDKLTSIVYEKKYFKKSEEALPRYFSDELQDFMHIINKRNKEVIKPELQYDYLTGKYADGPYIKYYAHNVKSDFQEDKILTLEEIEKDLDVLLRALETNYGAYYYFGGDEIFQQAKEKILEKCRSEEEITAFTVLNSIYMNLSFIQDCHFTIESYRLHNLYVPYFYRETQFQRNSDGVWTTTSGKCVASVEGWNNLDELFKYSISSDGELVYYPVVLRELKNENTPSESLNVHYTDGSVQKLWPEHFSFYKDETEREAELYYKEEIPIMFLKQMYFDESAGDISGKASLSYANTLREERVSVVDLRVNNGGNGILPFKWLKNYTGEYVTTNITSLLYWTMDDVREMARGGESYNSFTTLTEIGGWTPLTEHYLAANAQPDIFIENDNLLIVLTGKSTASAAEYFVDMTHNIENTLVIGENTMGGLRGSFNSQVKLPNSHIMVSFGSKLSFFPDGDSYFKEFTGFLPDIWVPAGEAEELSLKFINNYFK